jgi:CHAD domain-containing protein
MDATEFCQSNAASQRPPHDSEVTRSILSFPRPFTVATTTRAPQRVKPHSGPVFPTSTGESLATSLHCRWDTYQEQLRSCQRDFSERSVHELRVATRRLLAHLSMLEGIAPIMMLKKIRRTLKRRLKPLGELRDLQVQLAFIEQRLDRFPELVLVRSSLRRHERKIGRSVARQVKRYKTAKLGRWISSIGAYLSWNQDCARRSYELSIIVTQALTEAFAEVVCRRQEINPNNLETVHQTRIAFKRFRYMAEALSPGFTGMTLHALRKLAHYQRRMGALQDLEVMRDCMSHATQKKEELDNLLRPFNHYLRARRTRALRAFLRSADDLFEFWPPCNSMLRLDAGIRQNAA